MKAIELRLNSQRRFENSYNSDDLQEKWAQHDFCSVLDVFHDAVNTCPPPKPTWVFSLVLLICWSLECGIAFLLPIHRSTLSYVILPMLMFLTVISLTWRQRVVRIKFEAFLLELAERLNATENIRGIHYSFTFQRPHWSALWSKSTCTLRITLDDRYHALTAHSYTKDNNDSYCVSIPDVAHVPQKLDAWDEKSYMYR